MGFQKHLVKWIVNVSKKHAAKQIDLMKKSFVFVKTFLIE